MNSTASTSFPFQIKKLASAAHNLVKHGAYNSVVHVFFLLINNYNDSDLLYALSETGNGFGTYQLIQGLFIFFLL